MKRTLLLALLAAGSVWTAALADDTPMGERGMNRAADRQARMDATSSDADLAFAASVISHARLAREASEYVASKATNPDVKKLAEDISSDQKEVSEKIQAAAKKEGITLHPDNMLMRDQALLDFMKELPVASLERMYVFHVAGANQTHLLMAQWAAKNAKKAEIRQAAQEIATKLETRSATIQTLAQAQVSGGSRTASEMP